MSCSEMQLECKQCVKLLEVVGECNKDIELLKERIEQLQEMLKEEYEYSANLAEALKQNGVK